MTGFEKWYNPGFSQFLKEKDWKSIINQIPACAGMTILIYETAAEDCFAGMVCYSTGLNCSNACIQLLQ